MPTNRLKSAPLQASLLALLAGAIILVPACGGDDEASLTSVDPDAGSAGSDASQPGDSSAEAAPDAPGGAGGADASDAQAEAGSCDVCNGKTYVPCTEGGTPGQPIACGGECVPGKGCVTCTPGELSCAGDAVAKCKADGLGTEIVETCGAQTLCHQGACKDACAVAAAYPSNVGCEFWAADLDQQDSYNDPATPPVGLFVSNPGMAAAVVKVEINTALPGSPVLTSAVSEVTLAPGASSTLLLPSRELDCGIKPNDYASPGTCLSSKAFRITATRPIAAIQFNPAEAAFSNDASLLLPTHALGKSYRALGWPAGHPVPIQGFDIIDRSYVTIVGTTANTQVTVGPTWRIKGNPPVAATLPGGQLVVVIGPFDVLNLETDDGTNQDDVTTISDLSGTSIEASAPVAVFTGAESTGAPGGVLEIPTFPGWDTDQTCCLDHVEAQMLPSTLLGSSYALTRSPVRSSGSFHEPDILRFVGVSPNTQVTTSLPKPFDSFLLQPGEVKTTWTQGNVVVSASAPVLLGQILVSGQYAEPALGDPSLTLFPSIEQYRTTHDFLAAVGFSKSWAVISEEPGTIVKLDGQSTDACVIEPIGQSAGRTWQARRCEVAAGAHRLTADRAVGVMVYGYSSAASYAYVAGLGALPPGL